MKTVRTELGMTFLWFLIVLVLIPGGASWLFGNLSMVRLDPVASKDYDCIFIEGHTTKHFQLLWLSNRVKLNYLRIRFTPNAENQQYGTLFVDPRTFAYEAHNYCVSQPVHMSGRLDSPRPILDWINSQPYSFNSPSHTKDAQEIFGAIRTLSSRDLDDFTLPANYIMNDFVVGYHTTAKSGVNWPVNICLLLLIWLPVASEKVQKRRPKFRLA